MTGLAARAPKTLIFEWEQGAELPVDILETGGQIEIVIMQARRAHFYMHYTAAMCACAACRFAMLHNETAAAVYAGLSREGCGTKPCCLSEPFAAAQLLLCDVFGPGHRLGEIVN